MKIWFWIVILSVEQIFASGLNSELIKSKSSLVVARTGNLIVVKNNSRFNKGDKVLFLRPTKNNFDVLARGVVNKLNSDKVEIELEKESVLKQPQEDDLTILIDKPYVAPPKTFPESPSPGLATQDPENPGDPGYIEWISGGYESALSSEAGIPVNQSKRVSGYRFQNFRATWYIEYYWRLGIDYEKLDGIFPTSTYFREKVTSSQKYTRYGLSIRSRKFFKDRLRYTFHFSILKDVFGTDNADENLLTTSVSGNGISQTIDWEFESALWTSKKRLDARLQKIFFNATLFPSLLAQDGPISRGTSAGSNGYEYRLGLQAMVYLPWIPVFKRWVVDAHFGQTFYNFKFTGPTASEANGIYSIPEGSSAAESRFFVFLGLGIRFDDFISKFFKPK